MRLLELNVYIYSICRFDMVQMKIDERKLIQFGHLHGLIRKLNKVFFFKIYSTSLIN